jgi:hypothetical protein
MILGLKSLVCLKQLTQILSVQTTAEFVLRKRKKARNFENLIKKDSFVSPLVRTNGQTKSKNIVYIWPTSDIVIRNLILLFAGLERWHFVQCLTHPKTYRNSSQHKWLKIIFQGLHASTYPEIGVNENILVALVLGGLGQIRPKISPFSTVFQVGYEHEN